MDTDRDAQGQRSTSSLFLVRMWEEDIDNRQVEWRGRLLHVVSGKAWSFGDWPELVCLLTSTPMPWLDEVDERRPGAEVEK